jgi:GR25 family glycosyltransferase involved in LPS biosynthesis
MKYNKKYVLTSLVILFFISWIIYSSCKGNEYENNDTDFIPKNTQLINKFDSNLEPISVKDNNLKIILINLDKRKDRLQSVITSYNKSDLSDVTDLYRLAAIDGRKQIDNISPLLTDKATKEFNTYKQTGKRLGHHSLTEGAMGCYMSHVLAWKNVKEMGVPCIIAEDDIFIPNNTYKNILKLMNVIEGIHKPRPYIVLFHSICKSESWDKLECVPIKNGVFSAKQFWGTAFYYVTPEVAEFMLDRVLPIKYQIDHAMSRWNREGLIDIFYMKNIVDMAIYDTDIQSPLLLE